MFKMATSNQISIESSENNIASQSFNKCEDKSFYKHTMRIADPSTKKPSSKR